MKTTVQLSIKKPCQQSYGDFTKTPRGGFCQNCSKEVIDFTGMTNVQLIHYFSKANGNTCGRFLKSQLNTYESINQGTMNKFLPKTMGIAGFSLLALCAMPNVVAQDIAITEPLVQTIAPKDTTMEQVAFVAQSYTVKGIVLDEEKQPLPGVNVVLKGTTTGTQTDFDGKFEFPQPLEEGDVLIFSYLGYDTKTYKVKAGASTTKEINIQFEASDVTLLGEISFGGVHKTKRTFFQRLGDLFR